MESLPIGKMTKTHNTSPNFILRFYLFLCLFSFAGLGFLDLSRFFISAPRNLVLVLKLWNFQTPQLWLTQFRKVILLHSWHPGHQYFRTCTPSGLADVTKKQKFIVVFGMEFHSDRVCSTGLIIRVFLSEISDVFVTGWQNCWFINSDTFIKSSA